MIQIRTISRLIAAAGLLAVTSPAAIAQERSEVEPGEAYIAAEHSDWDVRCIRSGEDAIPERCEMFQLLRDPDGNAVAVFRVNAPLNPTEGHVASAMFMTPIETFLPPGLRLRVDDGEPGAVPFAMCDASGCMARVQMDQETVDMFQAGGDATIQLFALVRDGSGDIGGAPVELTASLRGFTAAYDDMQASHEILLSFIRERQAEAAGEGESDQ
ncbi:invasion associated locus B family protein [Maritalea mobilis]|uniref:invasion associated locus B family protein n=1 Tax=Maritalea mobilis TaxID=483324 RepID=UPI001C9746B5|nr:invasion associated locus B family protein [Maritalea mobilis]MBY6200353.1 invasion associated locus B family protein [Maritalea mobilis]